MFFAKILKLSNMSHNKQNLLTCHNSVLGTTQHKKLAKEEATNVVCQSDIAREKL